MLLNPLLLVYIFFVRESKMFTEAISFMDSELKYVTNDFNDDAG